MLADGVIITKTAEKSQNNELLTIHGNGSNYVKEYPLPTGAWPNGILVDNNGIVWIAGSKINSLFRFDPKLEKIQSFEIKDTNSGNKTLPNMVWTMLQDNYGKIWFSQLGTKSIWNFDPDENKFAAFYSVSSSPFQMKIDQSGNIWFTTLTGNTIGVIQKNNDKQFKITEFNVGNETKPAGLFLANDSLWITNIANQKIIKYHIKYDNKLVTNIEKVKELPSSNNISLGSPTDIYLTNNTIWLTEHGTSFLTKFQTEPQNIIRFPTSQNVYHVTTLPFWLRSFDDKGIWFNEHEGNKIAFFNTVNNTLTEYEIPSRPIDGYVVFPLNIATDPSDGSKLWFSEWNTDKFGMIDNEIPLPFEIHSDMNKIILQNDSKYSVNIEISKTTETKPIFLNVSSSMEPTAGLDIDARFSNNPINLTKTDQVQLLLQNNAASSGNYTLGISAFDGTITKTIFVDLEIKNKKETTTK